MAKRLALVTGGTRGIGRAICEALKASGYIVVANYARNDKAAEAFKKDTGCDAYKWNVNDLDACEEGVKQLEEDLGQSVDILVNNAGITRDSMMHKMDTNGWHDVIETNLTSCFNMSRAVISGMRDRGFGRIVNVSSINALLGQMGQTNYSAAKAGMLGFTKALARESAFKGITVNAIAPGYTNTEMMSAVPEKVMQKIIEQIPVGRVGEPEDIARCIVFLVADEAGFITGETISVNGGHHML